MEMDGVSHPGFPQSQDWGWGSCFGKWGHSQAPSKKDAVLTGPRALVGRPPPTPCPGWGSGSVKCILDN